MNSLFKYFSLDYEDESSDKSSDQSYNNKLVLDDYSSDEDLETISLSSQHDDTDSFYSDETPCILAVIMNTPDQITELNQVIMDELDIIIKSVQPNKFLILNNKYNDLYQLTKYYDCTVIVIDDVIKTNLVIKLPDHIKIFNIQFESNVDPINSIFRHKEENKPKMTRSYSSPGKFFMEEFKFSKIYNIKNNIKTQIENIVKQM